jgi:DNA-binding HxlR family transcriptional regulator
MDRSTPPADDLAARIPPIATTCPIARSLDRVGSGWSIHILRDALAGLRRFDEFRHSLGIAPNILASRLAGLVKAGLLERRAYQHRPPRFDYLPTPLARDFRPVLWALLAWGNRNLAPEGASVVVADRDTGAVAEPVLVDRVTGAALDDSHFRSVAGPAANDHVRRRYAALAARQGELA